MTVLSLAVKRFVSVRFCYIELTCVFGAINIFEDDEVFC